MTSLPVPSLSRWQPLRSGLMNLFLYQDEIFEFEHGRLLLRGNNGTGKSRVLALQLPFLLDGETRPDRVEPDGDAHRRIEWHLLMNGRYDDRIGYTWLEFGRLDDANQPIFCTIGCGLSASKGRAGCQKWFFLTDRRIGDDLALKTETGTPLTKARLETAIGDRGAVFESATQYRRAIDEHLFGLGQQRYGALVDLLIQLRKPQLSRTLDEERLSTALSDALPPLGGELLDDVAEAFRSLERERDEVVAYQDSAKATRDFLVGYHRYVGIAARRKAGEVRAAQSAYEATSREVGTAERELVEKRAGLDTVAIAIAELDVAMAASAETVRTLEAGPEMREARELDAAREHARALGKRVDAAHGEEERARNEVAVATTELESAEVDVAAKSAARDTARCALLEAAGGAQLADRVQAITESLSSSDAEAERVHVARKEVEGEVQRRRGHVSSLKSLHREARRCDADVVRAQSDVERESLALDNARDARARAARARDNELVDLTVRYESWATGLTELIVPEGVLRNLAMWAESTQGEPPITAAVATAYHAAFRTLTSERPALARVVKDLHDELVTLDMEKARLDGGHHEVPPALHTRDEGARGERPGAPLWAICDFVDGIDERRKAGYEAALEASGLLDAWVTPEGLMGERDVFVTIAGFAEVERSLHDVLRPAIDAGDSRASGIGTDVVAAILRRIGCAAGTGSSWVDDDGRFGVGVLAGHWSKARAQYVGHGARELARRLRLEQIEVELVDARHRFAAAERDLAAHDERIEVLEADRRKAPSEEGLRGAVNALTLAYQHEGAAEARRAKAREELEERRDLFDRAASELARAAEELGLGAFVERLEAFSDLLNEVLLAAGKFFGAHELFTTLRRQCELARARAADATDRHGRHAESLSSLRLDHAATSARVNAMEATSGARVEEILTKLDAARERLSDETRQRKLALDRHGTLDRATAMLGERVERTRAQLDERLASRAAATEVLRGLVATRLLAMLGEAFRFSDDPVAWSMTRLVEVARDLEAALVKVAAADSDWDSARRALHGRLVELDTALARYGHRPTGIDEGGVHVVSVPWQGSTLTAHELADLLDAEVENRKRILDAREREILEQHLLGEISTQLHEHIRGGEELVAEMNKEVEGRAMSTGMRLKFAWKSHPDAPAGFADARARLLATQGTWSPSETQAVGEFLHARIHEVRAGDDAGTWREQLTAAFDYRKWHRFSILLHQEGEWKPLNRRTHGTGSGGEKAVALTLPQVAAAAAHYRSAAKHAPRLILLDEVFVGIDNDMRSKCFGLLEAFELDFVMTSEREWGCHATVPGLAIYQLTARAGIDAIHTTRFVWDGHERHRDEGAAT